MLELDKIKLGDWVSYENKVCQVVGLDMRKGGSPVLLSNPSFDYTLNSEANIYKGTKDVTFLDKASPKKIKVG